MKIRNEIGVLFVAALMLFALVQVGANETVSYGAQAISAESSGFDALALQVFGKPVSK